MADIHDGDVVEWEGQKLTILSIRPRGSLFRIKGQFTLGGLTFPVELWRGGYDKMYVVKYSR